MKKNSKYTLVVLDDYAFEDFHIGKSNDFWIIYNLVMSGVNVYITDKKSFIASSDSFTCYPVKKFLPSMEDKIHDAFLSEALNMMFCLEPKLFYTKNHLFKFSKDGLTTIPMDKNTTVWIRLEPSNIDVYTNFEQISGKVSEVHDHKMIAKLGDKGFPYIIQSGEFFDLTLTDYICKKTFPGLRSQIIHINDASQIKNEPAILKPLNMNGGIGIQKIQSASDAPNAIKLMKSECEKYGSNLDYIIVQEIATHANLGDVRVYMKNGIIFGAFNRVPQEAGTLANFAAGGRQESIMRGFLIKEFDALESEILKVFTKDDIEYKQAIALRKFIAELQSIIKESSLLQNMNAIGFDALLTEENSELVYKMTEANLTSPLGESHVIIDGISADKDLNRDIMEILKIETKYTLMQDYVKHERISRDERLKMREILNEEL